MDIAKIRKKIKEESEIRSPQRVAEGDRGEKEGKPEGGAQKSEDKAADDITAGAQQPQAASGKTEDSKQQSEVRSQGSGAKSQTHVPAQVVSEQEVVIGKSSSESAGKQLYPWVVDAPSAKPVVDSTLREEAISGIIELLTFQLAAEEFAFRISEVEEILTPQQITMVPKAPDYVLGITSLRGKVIPVIDLKTKLSLTDKPSDIDHKGKILIIKGPKGPIGAQVDKVTGIVRITKTEIIPPPSHLTETELRFIEGVTVIDKRFISIIHMEDTIKI